MAYDDLYKHLKTDEEREMFLKADIPKFDPTGKKSNISDEERERVNKDFFKYIEEYEKHRKDEV